MNDKFQQLRQEWQREFDAEFSGWNFSHIDGRTTSEPLCWNYREMAERLLCPEYELLDMGTGGGEFLESLGHPYERTSVTEGWDVNLAIVRERLAPKGVRVEQWAEPEKPLPFESESFDVVLNRHESYDFGEVYRVLKRGGIFLTEQVGGENSIDLSAVLTPERVADVSFNLTEERRAAELAGFEVLSCAEQYAPEKFYDIGALVWFCRVIEWEFPGFSVDRCFDKLIELQERLERDGCVENREHRFVLMLRKK